MSGWRWAWLIVLAGCQPAPLPNRVSVRVDSLGETALVPPRATASQTPGIPSAGVELGSQPEFALRQEIDSREIQRMIGDLRGAEARTRQLIFEQRLRRLDSEFEAILEGEKAQASALHAEWWDAAYARTREPFDRLASAIFPIQLRLPLASADERKSLEAQVQSLTERYLNERNDIFLETARRIEEDLDSVAAWIATKRSKEERMLAAERSGGRAGPDPETQVVPLDLTLDPVSGQRVEFPTAPGMSFSPPALTRVTQSREWTERLVAAWARAAGVTLVPAQPGVRDATEECKKWIQDFQNSP